MTTFTPDNLIAGDYPIKSKDVTVLAGEGTLARGTALGKITKGAIAIAAGGGNTGNGAAGAITRGLLAIVGTYALTCISASSNSGTFKVIDPTGRRLNDLVVAQAYDNGHFSITIADGSADFIVGDTFTVTVAAGSGKYRCANSANTDGSAQAEVILAETTVVAVGDDSDNVPIYETGEFNEDAVSFGGSDTADTHRDFLRARGIFLRTIAAQS